ncbi:MAG: type II toxin-antitoxin system VapC family toxin [Thermoleophilia bacterium]|nr:type II toxin-antitoxin system VapC family toxin [Thermoleophilia bacterium]
MILYLDGSALVKLVLTEPGSTHMRSLWRPDVAPTTSTIAYAEVRAAIAAAARGRRISPRRNEAAVAELDAAWELVYSVDVDETLSLFAGALAARHGLRALDAVHLASARSLAEGEPVLVSWDVDLRTAAAAEGLVLSPA